MRLFVLSLLFATWSTAAVAELPPREELKGWQGHALEGDVEAMYQRHKIVLAFDPAAQFTKADILSFEQGVRALGPRLVRAAGKPVVLRRRSKPCLFGIGRHSKGCPTFGKNGEMFIYDLPPIQGVGPVARLAPLSKEERRDLQRRRAVVHAMVWRIDQDLEWSKDRLWRDLNGWKNKRKSLNLDEWGYSRYLGQASPRLDLVTFAEAFFVRPQDVTSKDLDANTSLQCQEFTRARYMRKRIAELDKKWTRKTFKTCPEFERWANFDALEDIDFLVAAASSEQPESLYGHLLVHLRYEGASEGFEPVYQFGAVTPTNVSPIDYFTRGLLGGFTSVLEISSFRETDRMFLQTEQRNLKRFRLNLDEQQKRQLVQRIWEMERRHRYPYVFFRNNCASFLYDLIGTALSIHFKERRDWIISPTDVLDTLAETEIGSRGPLLRKRPLTTYSSREIALRAIRARRKAIRSLFPGQAKSLLSVLESKKPAERERGYGELFLATSNLKNAAFEERLNVLYQSVQIEKYFAEVAATTEKKIAFKRLEEPPVYSVEQILARRRELFREEALEARYEKVIAFADEAKRALDDGAMRPPNKKEERSIEWASATAAAYDTAVTRMGDFIDAEQPDFDAISYLETKHDAFETNAKNRDRYATGPSGKGRFSVGWGYELHSDIVGDSAMTRLGAAFIKERLGEQRRRGFRSDIESIALELELQVPIDAKAWRRFSADVTIFSFISATTRVGPVRRSFFDSFGWGTDIGVTHRGRHGVFGLLYGSGGLVFPIWSADRFAHFLVAGAYVDVRLGQTQVSQELMGGGYAWLRHQLHLYGNYANVFELEASTHHHFSLPAQTYLYKYRANVSSQHVLFFVGQHPLLLRPFGRVEYSNFAFPKFDPYTDASIGLDIELPL